MIGSSPDDSTNRVERAQARKFLLADPEEAPKRARFRRWLALVAAVAIVIAAGLVGGSALISHWALINSYEDWMRHELRTLMALEADYYATHGTFADSDEFGTTFIPSQGVYIDIQNVTDSSWQATAVHVRSRTACFVSVKLGGAGNSEDLPSCERQ